MKRRFINHCFLYLFVWFIAVPASFSQNEGAAASPSQNTGQNQAADALAPGNGSEKKPALTPDQEKKERDVMSQFSNSETARALDESIKRKLNAKNAAAGNVDAFLKALPDAAKLDEALDKNPPDIKAAKASIDETLSEGQAGTGPLDIVLADTVEKSVRRHGMNLKQIDPSIMEKFSGIVQRYPNSPESHQLMGRLRSSMGEYKGAIRDFTTALALDPANEDALQGRSDVRYKVGDYPGAVEDARTLLRLDPGNKAALVMLQLIGGRTRPSERIDLAVPAQNEDAALVSASIAPHARVWDRTELARIAQTESARYAKEAASALDVGDFDRAVEQSKLAIQSNPNNAKAYNYQAIAFIRSGKYDQALEGLDQALRVLPKNTVLTITQAFAFNRLGRYAQAKEVLQDLNSRLGDSGADASYNLAYAEAGLGDRQAMLSALGRAADLDPGRFGPAYQMAVQAPDNSDLTYLFGSGLPNAVAVAASLHKSGGRQGYLFLVLALLVGGFLIALGLLHMMAPQKSRTAIHRLMAAAIDGNAHAKRLIKGTYKIIRQIGSGGMGTVYEAMDLNLQRHVALKKMRTEIRQDARERERFLNEARTVAALHHPNIVEIYSIVEDALDLCLVFEYVEGKNLHELLVEKGPFSFDQARQILKEVCRALEYAHNHCVIHRDLKPSNIMITRWGTLKVMDFGMAREVREAVSRLMTNTVAGTPPYMAPELEEGVVGKEGDVYSLGVCFYELLSGQVPFIGTGAGMLLNKKNMDFKPLSSIVKDLPSGVDELIAGALQADPAKRIKTPSQFLTAMGR